MQHKQVVICIILMIKLCAANMPQRSADEPEIVKIFRRQRQNVLKILEKPSWQQVYLQVLRDAMHRIKGDNKFQLIDPQLLHRRRRRSVPAAASQVEVKAMVELDGIVCLNSTNHLDIDAQPAAGAIITTKCCNHTMSLRCQVKSTHTDWQTATPSAPTADPNQIRRHPSAASDYKPASSTAQSTRGNLHSTEAAPSNLNVEPDADGMAEYSEFKRQCDNPHKCNFGTCTHYNIIQMDLCLCPKGISGSNCENFHMPDTLSQLVDSHKQELDEDQFIFHEDKSADLVEVIDATALFIMKANGQMSSTEAVTSLARMWRDIK